MSREQQIKKYYTERCLPVIERLMVDLLIEQPDDLIQYTLNWVNDKGRKLDRGEHVSKSQEQINVEDELKSNKGGNNPGFGISVNETPNYEFNPPMSNNQEPEKEEQQVADTKVLHSDPSIKEGGGEEKQQAEEVSDQGEEEEDIDEEEFKRTTEAKKIKGSGVRSSVSAEVYGEFNKKKEYVPKVIEKSEEAKQRITTRLNQAFMFSALEDKERNIVLNAMEECKFEPGGEVIKQGDDGEVLFVVDEGELDCFKKFKADEDEKLLKTYKPGEAFGELALLYNAPRAATIRAKTSAVLFSLDRDCFNGIVKEAAQKKRDRYEKTLSKVEILHDMDAYERTQLCDGIKEKRLKAGDIVINEGDETDDFYMVDEGKLQAKKVVNEGEEPTVVMSYNEGDYFGELALVRKIKRQATIVAETDSVVVYLDKETFNRLMGPIEELLKRNEDKYSKFWKPEDKPEEKAE